MESLGQRLSLLREKKGWTKTYVAKKLGMKTVSTYANWEYDTRTPDNEMLVRLAKLYEVTTDYLLGLNSTDLTDKEFKAFANDPSLQQWYKELPESTEEDLRRLRKMWDIIKDTHED